MREDTTAMDDIDGYEWPDTTEENERMARWIVGRGGRPYAEALLVTHTDTDGRIHPCGQTRRCAERALELLDEQDRQHLGGRHSRVES